MQNSAEKRRIKLLPLVSQSLRLTTRHYVLAAVLFLVTCHLLLVPTVANAQGIGFSLGTNIFDYEIPAGTNGEGRIVVFNNTDSPATPIVVDYVLWNLSDDSDDIEFVTAEETLNAATWFTTKNGSDFILQSGGDRNVDFGINVPVGTPPGSYFVMMRFRSTLPDFYFLEGGPRFIPELGALFFIKVPNLNLEGEKDNYGATIHTLEPSGDKIPFVENLLPRANAGVFDSAIKNLLANISNDGVYHFKMSGNVEIKNIFGRVLVNEELPARYLLPDRTRNIDITVLPKPDTESLPFFTRLFKSITYNLRTNTYFGPYSASVVLEIPDSPPVVKSVNFWVIPWQFWTILLIVTFGGFFLTRKFGSTIRQRLAMFVKILLGRTKFRQ